MQNYNSKNEKIINAKKIKLNKNNNSYSLTWSANLPYENTRQNLRQKNKTSNSINNHLLKNKNITNRNIVKSDNNYSEKYI